MYIHVIMVNALSNSGLLMHETRGIMLIDVILTVAFCFNSKIETKLQEITKQTGILKLQDEVSNSHCL